MGALVIPQDDREDRAYDAHRQRLLDAYLDGHEVGALGLPFALCPQEFTPAERAEWERGWRIATAALARRAA